MVLQKPFLSLLQKKKKNYKVRNAFVGIQYRDNSIIIFILKKYKFLVLAKYIMKKKKKWNGSSKWTVHKNRINVILFFWLCLKFLGFWIWNDNKWLAFSVFIKSSSFSSCIFYAYFHKHDRLGEIFFPLFLSHLNSTPSDVNENVEKVG